jgi:hypothetical protein
MARKIHFVFFGLWSVDFVSGDFNYTFEMYLSGYATTPASFLSSPALIETLIERRGGIIN